MSTDQSVIIEFLNKPESYGLKEARDVQRFDTHISIVFLVGDFAYKLKRAIQLPFVNFKKLEDRKKYCQLELNINQRASPTLYENVVPITKNEQGQLTLNGHGEVVDWLVRMKRFKQENLFESLAKKGELSIEGMEKLADHIVDYYKQADVDRTLGGVNGIKRAFSGHYKAFDNCPENVLSNDLIQNLKQVVASQIEKHESLMQDRQETGFVRQCHGDLHLRNICFFQGNITLFDAIEFEPDYAIIDVFYDLSFLLMDLCHRGLSDLANAVMNRYLGLTGDVVALNLLPLFMASRSAIRTHVNAVASKNQLSESAGRNLEIDARAYLSEALSYFEPVKPKLVAIGGLSGTGKSVLAKKIAPDLGRKPGAFIARTDLIRKRLMRAKPDEELSDDGYRPNVTQHTYNTLFVEIRMALHARQSVIVDGVFAKPEEREMLEAIAQALEAPFVGIWLEADLKILENRVESRVNDPSDADVEIVKLQSNYDLGDVSWTRLDADQTVETVYDKALKIIDVS